MSALKTFSSGARALRRTSVLPGSRAMAPADQSKGMLDNMVGGEQNMHRALLRAMAERRPAMVIENDDVADEEWDD